MDERDLFVDRPRQRNAMTWAVYEGAACERADAGPPLRMWAAMEANRRFRRSTLPPGGDIVRRVFGSEDFGKAVAAFGSTETVGWQGR